MQASSRHAARKRSCRSSPDTDKHNAMQANAACMAMPQGLMKLFSYLKKYARECILAPLFKLFEALLELFVPLVVASIVDVGIPEGNVPYIVRMIIILFVLAFTGLAVSITAQYFSAKAAALFARDAKSALFRHVETLSLADCDRLGLSGLINRMTGDMNQVQSGVNMTLRLLLRSPFVVLGAAVMAFAVDVRAALIFAIVIPVMSLIVFLLLRVSVPRFRTVQSRLDGLLGQTRENYRGARVIRAFNLQEDEKEKFHHGSEDLVALQMKAGNISILTNPMTSLVVNLGIIAVIWYGGVRVNIGSLSQGSVVALFNYMNQILVELIKLAGLIQTITRALASARRVEAVFQTVGNMEDGDVDTFDEDADKAIEFRNVTFRYNSEGDAVLKNVSFSLPKGQTLGIIGATGSGKSTLGFLIARLYDACEGGIEIFGRPIRSYRLRTLHDNVTLVLQKARLFRGTVRSNMLLSRPDAGEDEIRSSLSDAQALEFVEKKGLDCEVETGGRNFSGGQRQRLSIARGLVHGGKILILDDSFSALDYVTDSKVRAALEKRKMTKVIISQRASSVMNADLIILLENGRIEASGKHSELMETSPVYREIYYTQFEKEAD